MIFKLEIAKIMHSVTNKQSLYTTQNLVEITFIHHYNTRQATKRTVIIFFPGKELNQEKSLSHLLDHKFGIVFLQT